MVNQNNSEEILDIIDRFEKELKGALTTLIILLIIQKEKEIYGYKIKKLLKEITVSEKMITDSTLYTSLRSLESKYKLIKSSTDDRRVYYSLTESGSINIDKLIKFWRSIQITTDRAIDILLEDK